MGETIVNMLVAIVFLCGVAFHVALWVFKRGDVSLFDIYRALPNKYGVLWLFTKPEAYFRKKYVKYVRTLYCIAALVLCSLLLILLMHNL